MLAPTGAIAAGGLYTATEFDVSAFDALRPSLVEMGRAVVRDGHRNGGVVLLMWAGILAYLDRYGYDYVTGCVSVPIGRESDGDRCRAASCAGVRDFILSRHAAPPQYRVRPYRPVVDRRKSPRRHCGAAAADGSGADARVPAAGRPGLRRTGARPGLRRRRLLRTAGQTTTLIPDICEDFGRYRPPPRWPAARDDRSAQSATATPGCRAPRATAAVWVSAPPCSRGGRWWCCG